MCCLDCNSEKSWEAESLRLSFFFCRGWRGHKGLECEYFAFLTGNIVLIMKNRSNANIKELENLIF